MKFLILGHGRHGKDTLAAYLSKQIGIKYISSSEAALDAIYPALSLVTGISNKETLFRTRHDNRELWKRLISLYNEADRTALVRLVLSKADIYVGMRSQEEFEATRHLFDEVLWVDRSDHHPVDPTMSIQYDSKMYRIDNNRNLVHLQNQIEVYLYTRVIPHHYTKGYNE